MGVLKLSEKIDPFNLPEALQEKAKKELNEDLATRDEKLQKLKDLIKDDGSFPKVPADEFLLRFLRVRKYDINAAFANIKNYYKLRRENAGIFLRENPMECDRYFKEQYADILPETDSDGCIVYIILFGTWDVEDYDFEEFIKGFTAACDYIQRNPLAQINGVRIICDCDGFGLNHFQQYNPARIKFCATSIQDCFPIRFKGFHMLNASTFFDKLYALMKPLLKTKITERVFMHGSDIKPILKYVSKESLPEDIKGTAPPLNNKAMRETMYKDTGFIEELKELSKVH